jgi:hypothetical protein
MRPETMMNRQTPPDDTPRLRLHRQFDPDEGPRPRGRLRYQLADPEFREVIKAAEVVFGQETAAACEVIGEDDLGSGDASLFFGSATLERIVKAGKMLDARIMTIEVDFATDDPEVLVAACILQKGSCCYKG